LLAGVVGVSNIMIVTVRERTQEIGVRRALGATPGTIIRQIMAESFVLTVVAGLAGLVCGVGALVAVGKFMESSPSDFFAAPQVTFGAAVAALAVLVVFGLFAGFLPSKRALEIKAIDALRDE
ncbi:MAG: FtsX-like permease family protein, partial [bacterium]|nr:FtsX-like permease family protein [Candidatus Aphodosoma intestinipullorum]